MRCRTFSTLQPRISLRFIGWVLLNRNPLTRNTLYAGSLTQLRVCVSVIAPIWHLCAQTRQTAQPAFLFLVILVSCCYSLTCWELPSGGSQAVEWFTASDATRQDFCVCVYVWMSIGLPQSSQTGITLLHWLRFPDWLSEYLIICLTESALLPSSPPLSSLLKKKTKKKNIFKSISYYFILNYHF